MEALARGRRAKARAGSESGKVLFVWNKRNNGSKRDKWALLMIFFFFLRGTIQKKKGKKYKRSFRTPLNRRSEETLSCLRRLFKIVNEQNY